MLMSIEYIFIIEVGFVFFLSSILVNFYGFFSEKRVSVFFGLLRRKLKCRDVILGVKVIV